MSEEGRSRFSKVKVREGGGFLVIILKKSRRWIWEIWTSCGNVHVLEILGSIRVERVWNFPRALWLKKYIFNFALVFLCQISLIFANCFLY